MSQSNRWFALLLVLLLPASVVIAQTEDVYLYNENVVGDVNIGAYVETGDVEMMDGNKGQGSMKFVYKGPAPAPYPQILVWEKDVEQLGRSSFEVNGLRFINHGTHWVKNKKALVLWEIQIPNAPSRLASEFAQDLTLSFWVDWNQDQMWSKNELMIQDDINIGDRFPTAEGMVRVYYLTSFRVPDVDGMTSAKKPDTPDQSGNDKGMVYLWVRGIVSYDDPDVSPDGEQIFGEVEDYRVAYMQTPRNMKE
jgi:hypothetical protein